MTNINGNLNFLQESGIITSSGNLLLRPSGADTTLYTDPYGMVLLGGDVTPSSGVLELGASGIGGRVLKINTPLAGRDLSFWHDGTHARLRANKSVASQGVMQLLIGDRVAATFAGSGVTGPDSIILLPGDNITTAAEPRIAEGNTVEIGGGNLKVGRTRGVRLHASSGDGPIDGSLIQTFVSSAVSESLTLAADQILSKMLFQVRGTPAQYMDGASKGIRFYGGTTDPEEDTIHFGADNMGVALWIHTDTDDETLQLQHRFGYAKINAGEAQLRLYPDSAAEKAVFRFGENETAMARLDELGARFLGGDNEPSGTFFQIGLEGDEDRNLVVYSASSNHFWHLNSDATRVTYNANGPNNEHCFAVNGQNAMCIDPVGTAISGLLTLGSGVCLEAGFEYAPSLTFVGNKDTGIYSPADGAVAVTADSTAVARFDDDRIRLLGGGGAAGNANTVEIGINDGAINPGMSLRIWGDHTGEYAEFTTTGSTIEYNGSSLDHLFQRNGTSRLRITESILQGYDSTGSENWRSTDDGFGLGTTNPQGALDLGNGTAGRALVWGGTGGSNHYASIGTEYSTADLLIAEGLRLSTSGQQHFYAYTGSYGVCGIRFDRSTGDTKFFNEASASHTDGDTFDESSNTHLTIERDGGVNFGVTLATGITTGQLALSRIYGPNNSSLSLYSDGDVIVRVDQDNNSTTNEFRVEKNTGTHLFIVTEDDKVEIGADAQADKTLTVYNSVASEYWSLATSSADATYNGQGIDHKFTRDGVDRLKITDTLIQGFDSAGTQTWEVNDDGFSILGEISPASDTFTVGDDGGGQKIIRLNSATTGEYGSSYLSTTEWLHDAIGVNHSFRIGSVRRFNVNTNLFAFYDSSGVQIAEMEDDGAFGLAGNTNPAARTLDVGPNDGSAEHRIRAYGDVVDSSIQLYAGGSYNAIMVDGTHLNIEADDHIDLRPDAAGTTVHRFESDRVRLLGSTGASADHVEIGSDGTGEKNLRIWGNNAGEEMTFRQGSTRSHWETVDTWIRVNPELGFEQYFNGTQRYIDNGTNHTWYSSSGTQIAQMSDAGYHVLGSDSPTSNFLTVGDNGDTDKTLRINTSSAGIYAELEALSTATNLRATGAGNNLNLESASDRVLVKAEGTTVARFDGDGIRLLGGDSGPSANRIHIGTDGDTNKFLEIFGGTTGVWGQLRSSSVGLVVDSIGGNLYLDADDDVILRPAAGTTQLTLDGGTGDATFTGDVFLPGRPPSDLAAADKEYVDSFVRSRHQNLFTNGDGVMGDNTNMSSFTFEADQPSGLLGGASSAKGVFRRNSTTATLFSDELIPVDTYDAITYQLSLWTRWIGDEQPTNCYLGLEGYDVDGLAIKPQMTMFQANTHTTLAAPLTPGDTTITLADSANWYNGGGGSHLRTAIVWGYRNSTGYKYPDYTYSRYYEADAWAESGIDTGTHVITLNSPWPSADGNPDHPSGTWPVGTAISNGSSGSSYKYVLASNIAYPSGWTYYDGTIGGINYGGNNQVSGFQPGTAYVKVLFLINRSTSNPQITDFAKIRFGQAALSGFEVDDLTDGGHTDLHTHDQYLPLDGSEEMTGDLCISSTQPKIFLMETDTTDDNWRLQNAGGDFFISQVDDNKGFLNHAFQLRPDNLNAIFYGDARIESTSPKLTLKRTDSTAAFAVLNFTGSDDVTDGQLAYNNLRGQGIELNIAGTNEVFVETDTVTLGTDGGADKTLRINSSVAGDYATITTESNILKYSVNGTGMTQEWWVRGTKALELDTNRIFKHVAGTQARFGSADTYSIDISTPANADYHVQIGSDTDDELVALTLGVRGSAGRNPTARFYLQDGVQGSGEWGIGYTFSSLGDQPFAFRFSGHRVFYVDITQKDYYWQEDGIADTTTTWYSSETGDYFVLRPKSGEVELDAVGSSNELHFLTDGNDRYKIGAKHYWHSAAGTNVATMEDDGALGIVGATNPNANSLTMGVDGANNTAIFMYSSSAGDFLRIDSTSTDVSYDAKGSSNEHKFLIDGTEYMDLDTDGLTITNAVPRLYLMESDTTDDNWRLQVSGGDFYISQVTDAKALENHAIRIREDDRDVNVYNNLTVGENASPSAVVDIRDNGTSKGYILAVNQDDSSPWGITILNRTYSTGYSHGMRFFVGNTGHGSIYAPDDGVTPGDLILRTDAVAAVTIDGSSQDVSIDAGNLDITTGSLDVNGVGGTGQIAVFGDSTFDDKYILIRNDITTGIALGLIDNTILEGSAGDGLIKAGGSKGFAIKTNSTDAFADITDADFAISVSGQVMIGTTAPVGEGLTVAGHASPSVDKTYDLGRTTEQWGAVHACSGVFGEVTIGGVATSGDIPRQCTYYVAKHGDDANDGTHPNRAFLTFTAALSAALASAPTSGMPYMVECLDACLYEEDFTITEWVHVEAPSATVSGQISMNNDSSLNLGVLRVKEPASQAAADETHGLNLTKAGLARAQIQRGYADGNNRVLIQNATNGELVVDLETAETWNGTIASNVGYGRLVVNADTMSLEGDILAVGYTVTSGIIMGRVNEIHSSDNSNNAIRAFQIGRGQSSAGVSGLFTAGRINVPESYTIQSQPSEGLFSLFVNQMTNPGSLAVGHNIDVCVVDACEILEGRFLPVDARAASGSILPDMQDTYDIGTFGKNNWRHILGTRMFTNQLAGYEDGGSDIPFIQISGTMIPSNILTDNSGVFALGSAADTWSHVFANSGCFENDIKVSGLSLAPLVGGTQVERTEHRHKPIWWHDHTVNDDYIVTTAGNGTSFLQNLGSVSWAASDGANGCRRLSCGTGTASSDKVRVYRDGYDARHAPINAAEQWWEWRVAANQDTQIQAVFGLTQVNTNTDRLPTVHFLFNFDSAQTNIRCLYDSTAAPSAEDIDSGEALSTIDQAFRWFALHYDGTDMHFLIDGTVVATIDNADLPTGSELHLSESFYIEGNGGTWVSLYIDTSVHAEKQANLDGIQS